MSTKTTGFTEPKLTNLLLPSQARITTLRGLPAFAGLSTLAIHSATSSSQVTASYAPISYLTLCIRRI
ncbi:hypothetical protein N7523_007344 [Penicillium sp. IBT 18751x]|nr:hypothetical protein N7523_007344 [Penicillium sp. IBT 18751x]